MLRAHTTREMYCSLVFYIFLNTIVSFGVSCDDQTEGFGESVVELDRDSDNISDDRDNCKSITNVFIGGT